MVDQIDISAARESLPPDLLLALIDFEGKRDAYAQLQQRLSDSGGEGHDLLRKADLLERQAKAAEADLATMARSSSVSQSEINDELNRIETMRKEAHGLRFTANSRDGMQEPIALQLAAERIDLESVQRSLNPACWKALLGLVLGQPGMRESLLQAFVLTRDLCRSRLEGVDAVLLSHISGSRQREESIKRHVREAFLAEILQLFGGEEMSKEAPQLATVPPRTSGEPKLSLAQLSKQRMLRSSEQRR